MAWMEFQSGLPLNQVGYPPGRPKGGAVSEHFWPLFEPTAQVRQLGQLQPRLAARSASPLESGFAAPFPIAIPSAGRFP